MTQTTEVNTAKLISFYRGAEVEILRTHGREALIQTASGERWVRFSALHGIGRVAR